MTENTIVTVKLDTSAVEEVMQRYLEPGAVLMSADAVRELYNAVGSVPSLHHMYRLLVQCGAEVSAHDKPADDFGGLPG